MSGRAEGEGSAHGSGGGGQASGRAFNYRVLVAALWLSLQAALIVTADRRSDGAFGFRMFSESSTIKIALYRETGAAKLHVEDGVWSAIGPDGKVHRFTWYDRVPSPYWVFDRDLHASYGAKTQLDRLQAALDDVAAHIPDDAETTRLVVDVIVRRNGREPMTVQLTSRSRPVPDSARVADGGL